MRNTASVEEFKGSQRLFVDRNHPWVNQTSSVLLQSWRGNCDLQLHIFESDPKHADLSEIARITDYVVAYSCKGNVTWKEEIDQTRELLMSSDEITGDKLDVRRVVRKVMNKTASKRIISKQEAMVLLADLPLVECTETIDSVSINNTKKLRTDSESPNDRRFITLYQNRPPGDETLSPYQYFIKVKNDGRAITPSRPYIIPNFVGMASTPRFPVTDGCARHTIIVHTHWRKHPQLNNWIVAFNRFITSGECPKFCRLAHDRVMQ